MTLIEEGQIQDGGIVFARPVKLPDGIKVIVRIETTPDLVAQNESAIDLDFASLPFFGMWADREEMSDSAEWVRQEREKWRERISRD